MTLRNKMLLITAALAVLIGAGWAAAASSAPKGDPVSRAKAAGWKIDSRMEESMRNLPPESELYDVTGKAPREVRWVGPDDPNTTFEHTRRPPGLADDEEEGDQLVAVAAAAPNCTYRTSGPYKAAGYAQGDVWHECYTQIIRHEVYGVLNKWYNNRWYQMAATSKGYNGPGKIHTHPTYNCTATVNRTWKLVASAYTEDRYGNWYGVTSSPQYALNCG